MPRTNVHGAVSSMLKTAELSLAVPEVIAHRTARMFAACANPNMRDCHEFSLMGTEKVQAFAESASAMGLQLFATQQAWATSAVHKWWSLWLTPLSWGNAFSAPSQYRAARLAQEQLTAAFEKTIAKGLGPIHKSATANARRLRLVK